MSTKMYGKFDEDFKAGAVRIQPHDLLIGPFQSGNRRDALAQIPANPSSATSTG